MKYIEVMEELKRINYPYIEYLSEETLAMMHRHLIIMRNGYVGYAATITFLPHRKSVLGHKPETIKKMMINLYLHQFVRDHLFHGHGDWAKKSGDFQPFADFYIEAHSHGAVHRPHWDDKALKKYEFAERLHYHGLILVDSTHVDKMNELLEDDSLKKFHRGVMNSVIKRVENIGWTGYIRKQQYGNSDTDLSFGVNLLKYRAAA